MAEPFDLDEAIDYINRECAKAHPASVPSNTVDINCAGGVIQVCLSALPPGTLICSRVVGEFFKVTYDHWAATNNTRTHYTDEGVAKQVDLGWNGYLQESDFRLAHVGD